jgi:hypothetical protein
MDSVNLDHVRSMLKTFSYRRHFLAMRQQAEAAASDHGTIHLSQLANLTLNLDRRARDHRRRGPAVHAAAAAAREQPRYRPG